MPCTSSSTDRARRPWVKPGNDSELSEKSLTVQRIKAEMAA
jgi:hypothetical protein